MCVCVYRREILPSIVTHIFGSLCFLFAMKTHRDESVFVF
jgi:hypothetical protein